MIDKKTLIKTLLNKQEIVDYTYSILFLVIASFFLIFAIRPALTIAFSLQKESKDLKKLNAIYEDNVLKIVDIQSNMERIRDDMYLLDEALPSKPNLDLFIRDIQTAANTSGITLGHFQAEKIQLKGDKMPKGKKIIVIKVDGNGEYQLIENFINELLAQRRTKLIKTLSIARNQKQASNSALLNVIMEIEGYYL